MTSVSPREYPRCSITPHPLTPLGRLGDTDRYVFPQQVPQATEGTEYIPPVASEKFLMIVESRSIV